MSLPSYAGKPGHIYIMANPERDYVKIGMTTRWDLDIRAAELSANETEGAWTPYFHYWSERDCYALEQKIFKILKAHRLPWSEYFSISKEKALEIILREAQKDACRPRRKSHGRRAYAFDGELRYLEKKLAAAKTA